MRPLRRLLRFVRCLPDYWRLHCLVEDMAGTVMRINLYREAAGRGGIISQPTEARERLH